MQTSDLLKELRIDRDDRPPRPRGGRRLVAVAIVAVLVAWGWLAWVPLGPPTVRTVAARSVAPAGGSAGSVLDASGYVTARRQATVSAKITGKVTEVLIEEGQRVTEDAVLARLDNTEAKAQLSLARAQLAAARSQGGEIRALLEQAERDYARQHELFQRQLVAAQAMDAASAQRETLRAKLAASDEQVLVAGESVRVAAVALDSPVIRAPFGGVVVRASGADGLPRR